MSAFKEQLAKDLGVFVNVAEFADTHRVCGVQVPAVIDSSLFDNRGRSSQSGVSSAESMQAEFSNVIAIYLRQGALKRLPSVGADFDLDGLKYSCKAVRLEQGCDVIIASFEDSR